MIDHPALQEDDAYGIWNRLLHMAAHRPTRIHWRGQVVVLEAGEVAISERQWARDRRTTYKRLRVVLSRFRREGMIKDQPILGAGKGAGKGAVGTKLTICNYERFNGHDAIEGASEGAGKGATGAQLGRTEQESKNLDSEESSLRSDSLSAEADEGGRRKRFDAKPYQAAWNAICAAAGLPRWDSITAARARSLKARLSEPLFRDDPDGRWDLYLRRIVRDVGPDPPWNSGRPSIDWALRPGTPAKVHEGAYRGRGGNGKLTGTTGATLRLMEQFSREEDEAGRSVEADDELASDDELGRGAPVRLLGRR